MPYNVTMPIASGLIAVLIGLFTSACAAQPAVPQAISPDVDQTLTQIQQAAQAINTLTADIRYDRIQGILGDEQRRVGTLTYHAQSPAQFRIDFTKLILDDAARDQQRTWIFDGQWLAEIDGEARTFTRRQLVAEGENNNPLDLTAGPFALPLDFDKADILSRFDVTLIDDDPQTIHLKLTPKAHLQLEQKQMDLWYDRQTLNPVKAASVDDAENQSILVLRNVAINPVIDENVFDTTPPSSGWTVEIKPMDR